MFSISYLSVTFLLVGATVCVILLAGRNRRKAIERAKAEELNEANRRFEVWICRHCGFLSLMRSDDCSWCSAPRPDDFFSRKITGKEFSAQVQKPLPNPPVDGRGKYLQEH